MRILSLLPSATEIVYALGLGDDLVGVSHECDYPDDAKNKPIVSTSSLSTALRSDEIHSVVSEHRHSSHSLYRIDEQLLKQLDPEVILTQELCTVCAIPVAQVRDAARILAGPRCIVSLEPTTLHQVLENISAVAEVTGRQAKASALIRELEDRVSRIASATLSRVERFTSSPPITGQCETCRAKIVVRRDGARILLTVLPLDETDARRPDLRLEP